MEEKKVLQRLKNHKIALLAADGFEQSELLEPKRALEGAGAEVHVISLKDGLIKGWDRDNWGQTVAVNRSVLSAHAEDYDALFLPGGVMNPDKLRKEKKAVDFVRDFVNSGKPIAAICHGPQILIETDALSGRTVTSWPSIKTDLINAGAEWVDKDVVSDNGLVTSRKPADIPAFNRKMIEEFAEGQHAKLQRSA